MNPPQSPQFIQYHRPPSPPIPSVDQRSFNLVPPYIHNLPPAPQTPGKSALYLPHRLYVGQGALSAEFHPLPAPNIYLPEFPLPRIPGLLPTDVAVNLTPKLIPLKKSAYTTGPDAHTETAIAINALAKFDQTKLKTVKACNSFWENVCNYAGHDTYAYAPGHPHLNTWSRGRCIPIPTAEEQAKAVRALAGWYLSHLHRPAIMPAMTSEPSVQREVAIQMMEPSNALLKTRYTALKPPTGNLTESGGIPQEKGFPQWTHHCPDLHLGGSISSAAQSGFPDFLLRCFDDRNHAAIGEVKTWWSYTNEKAFRDLFTSGTVGQGGDFVWSSTEVSGKLVKQLWGQLHFFGCRLGFVTNGSVVMLVARTNPNTLILSVPRKWTDDTVLTALAGLSFAGVDMAYLNEEGSSQLLNTYLCPEAHRKAAWPEASQGQQGQQGGQRGQQGQWRQQGQQGQRGQRDY